MISILLLVTCLFIVSAVSAAGQSFSWNDTFSSFNSSLWTQQTDIEHCNDGACFLARPDHITYSAEDGLTLSLNQQPCNTTGCCIGTECADWASGHLASVQEAAYGTYEIYAQPAHAANSQIPPSNAFSCWTVVYVGTPVHNEIAICFSGSDSQSVHFSYWYDATAHTTLIPVPFHFSAAMHRCE